ncbi:MAG: EF2563 family selenium-dependent molybdenum hydroxylase system protein [Clostridiales Family XIII bacterium]|jgi:xanthine dehydrogenase accessory factor|nr:EF2563 family selenium-dependent molybdenum hydroxylase system protein [Clostridiales Family XIII bacterium]
MERVTVALRGGGDLATGVAQKLWRAGLRVVILELPWPIVVRRSVALASAVWEGVFRVEDVAARRVGGPSGCAAAWARGEIPLLIDTGLESLVALRPQIFIDATLMKRNRGVHPGLAPVTIALGPGFSAPEDADAVIETMRGHDLGRVIREGAAAANTGMPGDVGGKTTERVLHAPCLGEVRHLRAIGDRVCAGEALLTVGGAPVHAQIDGVLRGLIAEGTVVERGNQKVGDVDPREEAVRYCFSISDKARCLGGAVLEACLLLGREKGVFPDDLF